LAIGLAIAAAGLTFNYVVAGSARHAVALKLPLAPDKIESSVREMALAPVGKPLRRGSFYVLHARNPYGIEMRVVADAEFGDILSITPVLMPYPDVAPGTGARPHIIHVPRPGDEADKPPVKSD
jgi:hypothetical protein